MLKTRYRMVGVIGAVALVAAGCGSSSSSSSGSGGSTTSAQPISVALPHQTIFTVGLPYAVAEAEGFFKQNGVRPTGTTTSGGGATVQAVVAGSANIAMETGPASVMSAFVHGASVRIVAASTTGDDILLFSKASSPYKTLADLSGQKVGYSERGSSSDVNLQAVNAALKAKGLPPAIGASVAGPPDGLAAVDTGQIAAG